MSDCVIHKAGPTMDPDNILTTDMSFSTCDPCRRKKRKCDGSVPCARCSRNDDICTFGPPTANSKSVSTLRKGAACEPCRVRKKRCDAAKPACTPCTKSDRAPFCCYNEGFKRKAPAVPDPELIEASSSIQLIDPLQPLGGSDYSSSSRGSTPPDETIFEKLGGNVSLDLATSRLSQTTLDNLNRTFRVILLSHRLQLGLNLTFEKQRVILLHGLDQSLVHPFFVHFSHLFGCHLYHKCGYGYRVPFLEVIHLHETTNALERMQEEDDPETYAHANSLMAQIYLYSQRIDMGLKYLAVAADVINRHGIVFEPGKRIFEVELPQVIGYSEIVHERVAFLAQLIYLETSVYIVTGQLPQHFNQLELQFMDFKSVCPILSSMCPILLRIKSVLLFKDAILQASVLSPRATPPEEWCIISLRLIDLLTSHIAVAKNLLVNLNRKEDQESTVSLQYSIILSLTSIAQLHDLFTDDPGVHFEAKWQALNELLELSEKLDSSHYHYLDPILGICWMRAISLISEGATPMDLELSGLLSELMDPRIIMLGRCKVALDASPCFLGGQPHPDSPLSRITMDAFARHFISN